MAVVKTCPVCGMKHSPTCDEVTLDPAVEELRCASESLATLVGDLALGQILGGIRIERLYPGPLHAGMLAPPTAARVATILKALECAIRCKDDHGLRDLCNVAMEVLKKDGMVTRGRPARGRRHATPLPPPGGRYARWGEFESFLFLYVRELVDDGIKPNDLAKELAGVLDMGPVRLRPGWGHPANVASVAKAIEGIMGKRSLVNSKTRNLEADDDKLMELITKAMRAVGISTKMRKVPFQTSYKKQSRKLHH
jgi:hypothetical protein